MRKHNIPSCWGWSGGAMVLGKLPVLGRPTNLDVSRARAYCPCRRCGWGLFGHFFSHLSFLFSFSLSLVETARYRLKYCLKGPLSPKTTNQILHAKKIEKISPLCLLTWPMINTHQIELPLSRTYFYGSKGVRAIGSSTV